jgi:hypothetical protein
MNPTNYCALTDLVFTRLIGLGVPLRKLPLQLIQGLLLGNLICVVDGRYQPVVVAFLPRPKQSIERLFLHTV